MKALELHAAHLNSISVSNVNATIRYDKWADALVWSDETIESTPTDVIHGLRQLWHYRTHVMLNDIEPDNDVWRHCQSLFPNWIGFLPERHKPTPELLEMFRRDVSSGWRQFERQSETQHRLTLELCGQQVFYCDEYLPPGKNSGGSWGWVGPGGSVGGIAYERLRKLGNGVHILDDFDEHASSERGADFPSEGERLCRVYQFLLFMDRVGGTDWAGGHLPKFITAESVRGILPLITPEHRRMLAELAEATPPTRAERQRLQEDLQLGLLTINGFQPYPDESLVIIRKEFGA